MYRNQHRHPPAGPAPTGTAFAFFCERCGKPFTARHVALECPPCWLAHQPINFTLPRTGVPA